MGEDLAGLLRRPTVVVTSELQNGVLGAPAVFPALAEQVASEGLVTRLAGLLHAARGAGVPVVHGVAHRRPDGRGANDNARLFRAAGRASVLLEPGTVAAEVVPELFDHRDLVTARLHGLGPHAGTDLGALLTNLGACVVVVLGVSVNVAVTNLVMDLVNAGRRVVLPRDGVTGIPREYADAVLEHSLSLLATITTCAELASHWDASDGSSHRA